MDRHQGNAVAGIVGFDTYAPKDRISSEELARRAGVPVSGSPTRIGVRSAAQRGAENRESGDRPDPPGPQTIHATENSEVLGEPVVGVTVTVIRSPACSLLASTWPVSPLAPTNLPR